MMEAIQVKERPRVVQPEGRRDPGAVTQEGAGRGKVKNTENQPVAPSRILRTHMPDASCHGDPSNDWYLAIAVLRLTDELVERTRHTGAM